MADNLREILDIARRELPDVPPEIWARIERGIRLNFGTQRPYIAALRKRQHLQALADLDEQTSVAKMSEILGVTVRRVQQLQKLK